jgi:hypothetical protein
MAALKAEINQFEQKFQMFENVNNLNSFYNDPEFKKKIEKLNFKFYLETDRFLNFKTEFEKSQDNLFLILFKQVSHYVEEIEKLNQRLKNKEEKQNKNKTEQFKKETYDKELTKYKNTVKDLERQILNKTNVEAKLKKENESFRRQILFYQEKLKLELLNKKMRQVSVKKKVRFNDSQVTSKVQSRCQTPEKPGLKTAYKIARKHKMIKSAFNIPKEIFEVQNNGMVI